MAETIARSEPRDAYWRDGHALLKGFVPREVARGFLIQLRDDLKRSGSGFDRLLKAQPLLTRPASELYGYDYPPLAMFHWGMTPAVSALLDTDLLPSYAYFRLYRKGDICRVHGDRPSCEHSMSLTIGYADGIGWPLEVALEPVYALYARADDRFAEGERFASAEMETGDAVLYRGVHHHHGRTQPNPNAWSAHLFLHWVDREGPFAGEAFDAARRSAT